MLFATMTNNIVSVFLMGGLGNQLFQLFTTIAYAMKTKRKFIFPYSEQLTVGTVRPTYWDDFLRSLFSFTNHPRNKNYANYNTNTIYQFPRYSEGGFRHSDIPDFDGKNILLYGYYQSYKYFENEKKTILSFIQLKNHQRLIREEFPDILNNDVNVISMHFRLGDYKNIQDRHPLMTYEYYDKALEKIVEFRKNDINNVLYFCQEEDNEIVFLHISNLKVKYPRVEFIKVDDKIPDWKQMVIMSCCNDNIIANSTFSWWGAYFNENVDKVVCYPSNWFGVNLPHDVRDLFPSEWVKIVN